MLIACTVDDVCNRHANGLFVAKAWQEFWQDFL